MKTDSYKIYYLGLRLGDITTKIDISNESTIYKKKEMFLIYYDWFRPWTNSLFTSSKIKMDKNQIKMLSQKKL